ncbi:LytTR family two component transcriptional regulator [Cellulophaga geojensis KL-A]|uniref:Two component transcriptional regulator, LytTR family n=2 Tax=Cellulophaga TaxID=104264 RepID=F0RGU8_CELLC|nr:MULTISPECIES: response regulator transcription factor [Cellulophaga]ADY30152.1 two component transcriptional regulator, LytTR family [Cellulophaga lytica DSM 7489]TVZ10517.1 LytTR family two component transcriptional regulator [Cellulophaga sp. RHA_52]EWH13769.1 LytTR family two component transcriptional regulator [Cellulophaga geojensis KL-A]WQG75685.1 response regulator transcription factor [Cellulophaga lytica]SNQ43317.1 Two component transcriptional regulator, LytTR family [Cellulophaga
MIKLRTIIVDDEPLAINVLKNYVSQIQELELVETFSNAVAATTFVQNNEIDIIFLDINMPILDGLDFLKSLQSMPMVVMTTAHEEYALTSYELQAIDYLVKPIPFPRFLQAVQRIIKLKQGNTTKTTTTNTVAENPSIFIKVDKKKLQKIVLDDIMVIESLKDYIRIKTKSDKYIIHRTLSSFTDELPSDKFIRIHRSYTISISKVDTIEGNSLEIGGIRYTIGRSYINDVKETLLGRA